jgi:5-deoxy-5-amino-3-dehydroquinate synthase
MSERATSQRATSQRATSQRVRVDFGARGYDVVVGEGAVAELASLLAGRRRVAIVTQAAIPAARVDEARRVLSSAGVVSETFLMGEGEDHKSPATIDDLCRRFARWGLLRADAVVALGGGVVGDTAGFAAAVYHRGVDVVQVPTTLLAMVDSAIGGKTGVNLPEGKNLVGAFHQPIGVLADPRALATLPDREYRSGLGEVAKYALMGDDFVSARVDALVARDPETLADVIARCAALKARCVEADELERTGVRAVLNYGHTLGHALETATGHSLQHGEAVAVGLVFAAELATALERTPPDLVIRTASLVRALGLPVQAPPGVTAAELLTIMKRDKKSDGGLTFVLDGPSGIERVDDPDPVAVNKAFAAIGVQI